MELIVSGLICYSIPFIAVRVGYLVVRKDFFVKSNLASQGLLVLPIFCWILAADFFLSGNSKTLSNILIEPFLLGVIGVLGIVVTTDRPTRVKIAIGIMFALAGLGFAVFFPGLPE